MSPSKENQHFRLQGAFSLDGLQQDLFDPGDVFDGVVVAAAEEELADQGTQQSDGLFALEEFPLALASQDERNPALRLLDAPEVEELTGLDTAGRRERVADAAPAEVEVLVTLQAAGHALLVVSTIEREIRRCERAAQRAIAFRASGGDDAAVNREFVRGLARTPHPLGIKERGLRLLNAKLSSGGQLAVLMAEPSVPYASLQLWPRSVLAFATSAIADEQFSLSAESIQDWEIRLPKPRLKAIAGGVPQGALYVRLRGGMGSIAAKI